MAYFYKDEPDIVSKVSSFILLGSWNAVGSEHYKLLEED